MTIQSSKHQNGDPKCGISISLNHFFSNNQFIIKLINLQGLDSWFVPAFSAIADSTVLLNHVIPPDQGFTKHDRYCGIFHFRFWFGRWIEIVIDDLLPTRKGSVR